GYLGECMSRRTDRRTDFRRIRNHDRRGDACLPPHRRWCIRSYSWDRNQKKPMVPTDPRDRSTDSMGRSGNKCKSKSPWHVRAYCQQFFDRGNPTPATPHFETCPRGFGLDLRVPDHGPKDVDKFRDSWKCGPELSRNL